MNRTSNIAVLCVAGFFLEGCGTISAFDEGVRIRAGDFDTVKAAKTGDQTLESDGMEYRTGDMSDTEQGVEIGIEAIETCVKETYWKNQEVYSGRGVWPRLDWTWFGQPKQIKWINSGVDLVLGGLVLGGIASAAHRNMAMTPAEWDSLRGSVLLATGGILALDLAAIGFASAQYKRTRNRTTTERVQCGEWGPSDEVPNTTVAWFDAPEEEIVISQAEDPARIQVDASQIGEKILSKADLRVDPDFSVSFGSEPSRARLVQSEFSDHWICANLEDGGSVDYNVIAPNTWGPKIESIARTCPETAAEASTSFCSYSSARIEEIRAAQVLRAEQRNTGLSFDSVVSTQEEAESPANVKAFVDLCANEAEWASVQTASVKELVTVGNYRRAYSEIDAFEPILGSPWSDESTSLVASQHFNALLEKFTTSEETIPSTSDHEQLVQHVTQHGELLGDSWSQNAKRKIKGVTDSNIAAHLEANAFSDALSLVASLGEYLGDSWARPHESRINRDQKRHKARVEREARAAAAAAERYRARICNRLTNMCSEYIRQSQQYAGGCQEMCMVKAGEGRRRFSDSYYYQCLDKCENRCMTPLRQNDCFYY